MKHAIIPTDFSIRSLQPVHEVMNCYRGQSVQITLLHLVDVPDAIGDLLFRLRRMESRYPVPADFRQACEVIANKYDNQIAEIKVKVQYGSTAAYLDNLLEGFGADGVFLQQGYTMTLPFDESIDMVPLLRKTKCNIIETSPVRKTEKAGVSSISDLLLAGN